MKTVSTVILSANDTIVTIPEDNYLGPYIAVMTDTGQFSKETSMILRIEGASIEQLASLADILRDILTAIKTPAVAAE